MANYQEKNLKLLFWNARGVKNKKEELSKIITNCDILICVESWLSDSVENFNFAGFKTFRRDRQYAQGGGILMLIRNNLAYHEIINLKSPDPSIEIAGIKITNVKSPIEIVIVYRAPGFTLAQDHWDEILQNINTKKHAILMGDFNAHHVTWNCSKTDTNGTRLFNAIERSNLILHNTNSLTHFSKSIDKSISKYSNLDLIFSTVGISDKINVNVENETWGSDHFPVNVEVNVEKHIYRKKTFNIKSVRTNWDGVYNHLENEFYQLFSYSYDLLDVREKYELFINIVTKAIESNTPKKKIMNDKKHRNPVAWWDVECDRIKRIRKAAFLKCQDTNKNDDLIDYKKYCALARKIFKEKKRENLKSFAGNINIKSNSKYVWDTCRI